MGVVKRTHRATIHQEIQQYETTKTIMRTPKLNVQPRSILGLFSRNVNV